MSKVTWFTVNRPVLMLQEVYLQAEEYATCGASLIPPLITSICTTKVVCFGKVSTENPKHLQATGKINPAVQGKLIPRLTKDAGVVGRRRRVKMGGNTNNYRSINLKSAIIRFRQSIYARHDGPWPPSTHVYPRQSAREEFHTLDQAKSFGHPNSTVRIPLPAVHLSRQLAWRPYHK